MKEIKEKKKFFLQKNEKNEKHLKHSKNEEINEK